MEVLDCYESNSFAGIVSGLHKPKSFNEVLDTCMLQKALMPNHPSQRN